MKDDRKRYLVDTNIIIDNPIDNLKQLYQNGENKIFISDVILAELDKHKMSENEGLKFPARVFVRSVANSVFVPVENEENLHEDYKMFKVHADFEDGEDPIVLYFVTKDSNAYKTSDSLGNDYKIMETAKDLDLKIVTIDQNFKVIAKSHGVEAETLNFNDISSPDKISFFESFEVKESELAEKKKEIGKTHKKWTQIEIKILGENGYETGKKEYYLVNGEGLLPLLDDEEFKHDLAKPLNLPQKFYKMILSLPIKVLAVSGATGSGKTLLALQEGMNRVKDKNSLIDGIVFVRYTINTNEKIAELGFRKGDQDTKIGFYGQPLYSSMAFFLEERKKKAKQKDESSVDEMSEIEAIMKEFNIKIYDYATMRGMTIRNKFVIADEPQNQPNFITKLVGTRLKDSPIIFTGDIGQIDHPFLTKNRNSLTTLLKLAEEDDFIAGIKLPKTVRSEEAEWFEKNIP